MLTRKLIYFIEGLDCTEEMAILEKALKPQSGVKNISFAALQSQMTVEYDPLQLDAQEILRIIASTGMKGILLEKESFQREKVDSSFFKKNGRIILTILSGILLLIASFSHYFVHRNFYHFLSDSLEGSLGLPLITIFLYSCSILSGAFYTLPKAYYSLRRLQPDMNLLMIIAVLGAIGISQWFEAATVTFLFSLALLLEHWSINRARKAISALMDLSPAFARVILPNGQLEEKDVKEVQESELLLIKPGEKIPLDAQVFKGLSTVNQAPITGESLPVSKKPGDIIYAGTINEEGALEAKVLKKATDTTLSRIIHLVQDAQTRKAPVEQWIAKFAKIYTPLMLILALGLLCIPPLFFHKPWEEWIYRSLVLLVVACPCALVISTPVTIVSALTSAARNGILIKGGIFLEIIGQVKAIGFDKTGTLTRGRPEVQQIIPLNGHTEQEVLEKAAMLESPSEHPLARAIVRKANESNITFTHASDFSIIKGKGAEASLKGRRFWIGSHRFLHEKGQETPEIHDLALKMEDAGHSVIALGNDVHVCGLISVADNPRPFVKETLLSLKELGIQKTIMLTGDNLPTAEALAKETGIDEFQAELLPEDKVKVIHKLVEKYEHVAMVGDGVNDAPALSSSTVGIAMGSIGTDAAFETADMVLMADDLSQLPKLIRHSRKSLKTIKQNIIFSLTVKFLFVILAMFGAATLWMAIAADTGASLLVVLSGMRMLKFR